MTGLPRRGVAGPLATVMAWYAGAERDTVDADVPLERGLHHFGAVPGALAALEDELDEVLAEHDSGGAPCRLRSAQGTGLPAGDTHRAWLGYVRRRVRAAAAAGGRPPWPEVEGAEEGDDLLPPRAGTFPDRATAEEAVGDVLAAHRAEVEAWGERDDGRARLHLHADLGRPVGRVATRDGVVTATAVVVLLVRGPDRLVQVATSHPEVVLDEGPRRRWPDLTLALGGYFGADWPLLHDGSTWWAERALHVETGAAVRARVLDQLGELLELDDDDLVRAVDALGSHVRPVLLRRWLGGLRRRGTELGWAPLAGQQEGLP